MRALADLWRAIDSDDVFPRNPVTGLLGFLGWRRHLVPDRGLRHLVSNNVRFEQLEDAPIPLHVVVTDVLSGRRLPPSPPCCPRCVSETATTYMDAAA
jgi:NTE family protein